MQSEDWKREICEIFFAQRRVILWTTLLVFAGAVAIAFLWPPTYEATSAVLLKGKRPLVSPGSLEVTDVRNTPIEKEDVTSEIEILRSPKLIERTVVSLREEQRKGTFVDDSRMGVVERIERLFGMKKLPANTAEALADDVRSIRERLTVEVVPNSNVVRLSYKDHGMVTAERTLDTMLDQYLGYRGEVFNPPDEQVFFSQRSDMYRQRLEDIEKKLCEAVEQSLVTVPDQEMTNNIELKLDLMRRLSALRDEYVSSSFLRNPTLEARMTLLQMTLKEIESRNVELQRHVIERQRMQRETDLLTFSYETFAKRSEEARIDTDIAKSSLSGDVAILSRAAFSGECVFPKKVLTMFLGLIVGFLAGCSLGFTVEYFDHTLKSPIHVARYTGLPVICSIRKY